MYIVVTSAESMVASSMVMDTTLNNISSTIEDYFVSYFQRHNYITKHTLVGDEDSQHLMTTFVKYYDPAAVDVEDYDLLVILTNDSISDQDKQYMMRAFIFKTEATIERQEIEPRNVWSVDLLSPKDPNEATSLRLPVRKFVVVFRFFKDCSKELRMCQDLSKAA